MSIVKEYIDKNVELLDNVIANRPELAQSLVEALSILDSFANTNNLVFSDEEKNKILNESYELVNDDAIKEEIKDTEVASAIVQKQTQQASQIVEYSVLKLLSLTERGNDTIYNNFEDYMDGLKRNTYNGSVSNVPTTGYDKINLSCTWGKPGSVDNVYFEDYRVDVSVKENNPFYTPNILLSDYLTGFCYYLRFVFYQIKNLPIYGNIDDLCIVRSFFISCLDWQVDREKFRIMMLGALDYQLSRSVEDLTRYDKNVQDKIATSEEKMNLLREFLPKDFFQYLFEEDDYKVKLVVKDDIGINKASNEETIDLYIKTRLPQKMKVVATTSSPQVAQPHTLSIVTAPKEKQYYVMKTPFLSEAKRIIEYADKQNIAGSFYFNSDNPYNKEQYIILLDSYLDDEPGMSKRTNDILYGQLLLGESFLEENYPRSTSPKAKKTRTPKATTSTPSNEEDEKVFLEDIQEEDIKALESIGEIEDEDLTNFNIEDLDI